MKLWRKLAKKELQEDGSIKRTGRYIKHANFMHEHMFKTMKYAPPLLSALIKRAGFDPLPLTKAQAAQANAEVVNETE